MSRIAEICKQRIVQEYGYDGWFSRFVDINLSGYSFEKPFKCPFHPDSTASASVDIREGVWKCFAANCAKGGDVITFHRYLNGFASNGQALQHLAVQLGVLNPITSQVVDNLHRSLLSSPKFLSLAQTPKFLGIRQETIERFKIGLWMNGGHWRLTIPIRGEDGDWADIRRYNPLEEAKLLHWDKGYGAPRLFPLQVFQQAKAVVLFEGEKDCLRAHDFGISHAVTVTGGAGKLPESHERLFKGKHLLLCPDVDRAGQEGAKEVVRRLHGIAAAIYWIELPAKKLPRNGDFSDFVNLGGTMEDWKGLVAAAQPVTPESLGEISSSGAPDAAENESKHELLEEVRKLQEQVVKLAEKIR